MTATPKPGTRPLSPHLQVYRPQFTTILSILHRITGAGLAAGAAVAAWWLAAAAAGSGEYETFYNAAHSLIGRVCLFGFLWAVLYHFCNGIRHLVWDCGFGFKLADARKSGYAAFAASLLLTLIFWGMA